MFDEKRRSSKANRNRKFPFWLFVLAAAAAAGKKRKMAAIAELSHHQTLNNSFQSGEKRLMTIMMTVARQPRKSSFLFSFSFFWPNSN